MGPDTPKLTVDAVILYNGRIVLIQRKNPPFQGKFALPGGFVDIGETVEAAVVREALEETGLSIEIVKLLGVYSDPSRDPRGHTVSVAYLSIGHGDLEAGSDAKNVHLFDISSIPEMAFDHNKILEQSRGEIDGILSKM
ncbi:NUDIX domain-containing protein [Methanolobus halotolerans]|uniref:DNA mismatch repair protein MutT n=1 Tax=Methanolobus halotolerans TaxID=2052935 RepID=A0A4E0PZ03_9EURY|nr:NUDIX hydrolase [Methanolobus halotolerans]TGC10892.1 DNA mismatch repair protein MutT [Methanolobus halotolerans]